MYSVFICTKIFPIKKITLASTPPLVFLHEKQVFLRPISSIAVSNAVISSGLCCETDLCAANPDSYTVSYLVNSCGLSPETAFSVSGKLKFETPERPDSVLNLLRTYGLTKTQISNVVRRRPLLLLADPEKILLPKLEFFRSIGISRTDLGKAISQNPTLLARSLEKQIIPSYNYFKSVLQSDKKVVAAMKRTSWIFLHDHRKCFVPNIAFLRETGVPESRISLLLNHYPEALMQKHGMFREIINEVKEMGFDTMKSTFVIAVHVVSGKGNRSIWDRSYKEYRKWGWSRDDILSAFKFHPHCMLLSQKKISLAMDFFVNKIGWNSKEIARVPVVLFFNLEKRIIPRCSVIQVLSLKGLVKRNLKLSTILLCVEKYFLERFVTRYEEEVPQLLSVYRGEIDILEI